MKNEVEKSDDVYEDVDIEISFCEQLYIDQFMEQSNKNKS